MESDELLSELRSLSEACMGDLYAGETPTPETLIGAFEIFTSLDEGVTMKEMELPSDWRPS
jgi:hypothetical protein